MGTNYYFRKKNIDPERIETIVDNLNNDFQAMLAKYNEKLREAFSSMGIDTGHEFEDRQTFYSPGDHEIYGDIHVGKISGGWKPSMQATEHFDSIAALKQFYEQNKHEYKFINEYGEDIPFEDYLLEIKALNEDNSLKDHKGLGGFFRGSDGYDWTYTKYS